MVKASEDPVRTEAFNSGVHGDGEGFLCCHLTGGGGGRVYAIFETHVCVSALSTCSSEMILTTQRVTYLKF